MFEKVLFGKTKSILALLGKSSLLHNAYLAGGTACALHLGHRISYDLDFFTPKRFRASLLTKKIKEIGRFELDRTAWGTILGRFGEIRFSLFYYSYPLLFAPEDFEGVKVADLRDLAAMKIAAIAERGTKRDFIDLYAICQKISLKAAVFFYDQKYRELASNLVHIIKSLAYFEDAEKDVMPKMLISFSWREVKKFFINEQKKLAKKILQI